MIFQEPMTSLDPSFTIGNQLIEAYRNHLGGSKKAALDRAAEMLRLVGIPEPHRSGSPSTRTTSRAACASA